MGVGNRTAGRDGGFLGARFLGPERPLRADLGTLNFPHSFRKIGEIPYFFLANEWVVNVELC